MEGVVLVQYAEFGSGLTKNKPFQATFIFSEYQTMSETPLAPPLSQLLWPEEVWGRETEARILQGCWWQRRSSRVQALP